MRLWSVGLALLVVVLAPVAVFFALLRGSLPRLDGDIPVAGLTAPVNIERDNLGVPTVTAVSRTDLAYATGFLHGQDRFFEMDLSRRLAAGELSELVGAAALEQDESARVFRFRQVARQVLEQATPEQRAIIEAYSRGVNAGLASLNVRPWEYLALRARPAPWRPEDSVLVLHGMWWQLQYMGFHREMLRREVNDRLGGPVCGQWKCALQFFYPARTPWDAPAVGADEDIAHPTPVPGPEALDLRDGNLPAVAHVSSVGALVGSNNWAIAGSHTATGAALVANDMHLGQRVPVIWYRMRLRTSPPGGAGIDVTGVTLPGAPLVVAGSNGHIAWGFTNSYGKWLDVTPVPCSAVGTASLTGPSGTTALKVDWEWIRVHGAASVRFPVRSGPAGVLLEAHPERGQCWFASWLAQIPEASNFNLLGLERVSSVREALALAPTIGIPHQNFVVGDRDGHIGWAIYGRVPAARVADPRLAGPGLAGPRVAGPRIPAVVDEHREGGTSVWLEEPAQPAAIDPPVGRIWTANARVTSVPAQELAIGAGTASLGAEYDLGARASQIRADLLALRGPATPADMLRIQLDDRAVFLERWRAVLLGVLDAASLKDHPERARFRTLVEHWDAAADTGSVGYRLVRRWRDLIEAQVWDSILDGLHIPADASYSVPTQFQAPLLQLLQERPLHLLPRRYASWPQLMLSELDSAIAELQKECGDLLHCTWGRQNTIHIQHPLSRALPFLAPLLDMPTLELPGDHDMPRVQSMTLGASERFAVSPGHEAQGYFHMPGGQSGHPLSPYYRAGFMAWARGIPLPFLPGTPQHRMTLQPEVSHGP